MKTELTRNPIPIRTPQYISKWPSCPNYLLCLNEMSRRKKRLLNWTCTACEIYQRYAPPNEIISFTCPYLDEKEQILKDFLREGE